MIGSKWRIGTSVFCGLLVLCCTGQGFAEGGQPWFTQNAQVVPAQIAGAAGTSVPAGVFQVLPDFQVELLYTVPKDSQGSWVCITRDPQGRLLVSDQEDKGLYRITPAPLGSGGETKIEKLDLGITSAQGMLYAFDSLYLSINGGPGSGLYRARDTDGQGKFAPAEKLKDFEGGGEHGPHALRLSPDGKSLCVVCGNHTLPPANFQASRLPSNWAEDLLLPRQWDANGHARGILAPGGWVAKTDPDGKHWELMTSGYRNSYDMDFNADGELFVYDSDMEWDMGTPWYRPTRVVHATSGSELGWRSGTGKWPAYYADSLPSLSDIGPGSPVGVTFGYGAKFPGKYQNALFILDWTFGTMYALHLTPEGASYRAEKEEFVARAPLPLTDAVVGADGALYFLVGGRGTQSELYRVTYTGQESTAPVSAKQIGPATPLHLIRRQLETYHTGNPSPPVVVPVAYHNLGHADRHVRYAARIALEHQPVSAWQERVLAETHPRTAINGAIALARQGTAEHRDPLLNNLFKLDWKQLTVDEQLDLLRAYSLIGLRLGRPDPAQIAPWLQRFEALYPAQDWRLNRELCNVLVYLESPIVVERTLALMAQDESNAEQINLSNLLTRNEGYAKDIQGMLANRPQLQNLHYAFALRNVKFGWTLEQRRQYLSWLDKALGWSGGASYKGFLDNIRKDSLANASPSELAALESAAVPSAIPTTDLPQPIGPGQTWSQEQIDQLFTEKGQGRNFEQGKRTFAAARCVVCHRFAGEGGATGPDLTNVAGRFSPHDLTESLLLPSKVISDQYRAMAIVTHDGRQLTGRVVDMGNDQLEVLTDPEDNSKVEKLARADIESMTPAPLSLMPEGLLKPLNADEVLDLLAYLLSRGNAEDPRFRP